VAAGSAPDQESCVFTRHYHDLQLCPWQPTPCQIDADEIDAIIAKGLLIVTK
jgi:hypothetical protein